MKHTDFSDAALQKAARQVQDALLQSDAVHHSEKPDYSPEFRANMAALLKKHRSRAQLCKTLQRIAAACLAVLLSIGMWLTFDVRARETALDWIHQLSQAASWKNLNGTDLSQHPALEYVPGWLPDEGYWEADRQWDETECTVVYQKGSDPFSTFWIVYSSLPEAVTLAIDKDTYTFAGYLESGLSASIYIPKDASLPKIMVWSPDFQRLGFMMYFYFDTDTAVKVAKSLSTSIALGSAIEPRFPTYVPTSYRAEDDCAWTEDEYIQYYRHDHSSRFYVYSYHRIGFETPFSGPTSDSYTRNSVQVNGADAWEYSTASDSERSSKFLVWNDSEFEYCIWYHFDTETAICIAESVQ